MTFLGGLQYSDESCSRRAKDGVGERGHRGPSLFKGGGQGDEFSKWSGSCGGKNYGPQS